MAEATLTKVLMSAANPTGWKLEELMEAVIADMKLKTERVSADARPTAVEVRRLNLMSIHSLENVLINQRMVLTELDRLAPDQGPAGTPRIGAGSLPPFAESVGQAERTFIDGLDPEAVVVCHNGKRRYWMQAAIHDRYGRMQRVVNVNDSERVIELAGLRNVVLDPACETGMKAALYNEVVAYVRCCNVAMKPRKGVGS